MIEFSASLNRLPEYARNYEVFCNKSQHVKNRGSSQRCTKTPAGSAEIGRGLYIRPKASLPSVSGWVRYQLAAI